MNPEPDEDLRPLLLEALPDEVVATLEVRQAWREAVVAAGEGLEFIVSGLDRWPAGATVRVAFRGGDSALHRRIAEATAPITAACNIVLDFGETPAGTFRTWSTSDVEYAAEIRVSFDMPGFFSLVGTDSTDRFIGLPQDPIGGRPHQRSLNLHGFPDGLPPRWEGTVRHEFLHALAFNHEHQNRRGPCQEAFRFDDDPGYVPTLDDRGQFVTDVNGRRPGIYTFLAGEPNRWNRAKVDHNLRSHPEPGQVEDEFDPRSVMLYRFAALFYRTNPSPCAPSGDGVALSEGDVKGLRLLYPHDPDAIADQATRAQDTLVAVTAGQEAGGLPTSPYAERVLELLEELAAVKA